ncbi:hypothetical protein OF83DRAFT_1172493, partial [Amylostereum chailletii]
TYPPNKTRLTRTGSVLSTATTVRTVRKQTAHRDAALANLEGRGTSSPSAPAPARSLSRSHSQPLQPARATRNFMSMSDEESTEGSSSDAGDTDKDDDESGEDVFSALPTDVRPTPPPVITRSRSNSAARAGGSLGRMRGYSLSGSLSGKRASVSSLASTLANFLDFREDDGMGLAVRAA